LKLGLNGIILILLVTVALAVSGCSGSDTSGTATPTPQPGGGNMAGMPTATPTSTLAPVASEPSIVGQLYNVNDLHTYTYRLTSVVNGKEQAGIITISFTDTVYNGVEARRIYLNMDAPATGETGAGQIEVDVYTRKSDNSTLGGHFKFVVNGQALEYDIPADQASDYSQKDFTSSGLASNDAPLTRVGVDTVTIDGKTYSCTRYTYVEDGITYTVWYTPQAPMPVEMKWTDGGTPYTMELISWS
jgi:hypothetical protein